MSVSESTSEATLFDLRPNEQLPPAAKPESHVVPAADAAPAADARETAKGSEASALAGSDEAEAAADDDGEASRNAPPQSDRKRIEEQLGALKRKELELRRELVVADHPELAEPIRLIGNRAYAVARAEAKLAEGLSKTEQRKREGLEKKLAGLQAKRSELEGQIQTIELELTELGRDRLATFEDERRKALELLVLSLGKHEGALREAGLEASVLVPELEPWMPELEQIAKELVASAATASA